MEKPADDTDLLVYAPPSFCEWFRERLRGVPWWLVSLGVHVGLLVYLATVPFQEDSRTITVRGERPLPPSPPIVVVPVKPDPPLEDPPPPPPPKIPPPEVEIEPESLPEEVDAFAVRDRAGMSADVIPSPSQSPDMEPQDEAEGAPGDPGALAAGLRPAPAVLATTGVGTGLPEHVPGLFGWRGAGGKGKGYRLGGAPRLVPAAENHALRWLMRNQEPDGRWDARKHGARMPVDQGVTGLALCAFSGAGYVPGHKRYGKTIVRGLDHLRRTQSADGAFRKDAHWMYGHAICTLACTDIYALSRNPTAGRLARKGLAFMERVQAEGGGFGYTGPGNDTSVTGWCIMAMKSGKVAGLPVAGTMVKRAAAFLDRNTTSEGWTGYRQAQAGRVPLTAAGAACRLFLGAPLDAPRVVQGADHVRAAGVDIQNLYTTYYATLLMYQLGDDYWRAWNPAFARRLLRAQVRRGSAHRGSWDPAGFVYGKHGGRVYTTAMGALCLEVYYRYMPFLR